MQGIEGTCVWEKVIRASLSEGRLQVGQVGRWQISIQAIEMREGGDRQGENKPEASCIIDAHVRALENETRRCLANPAPEMPLARVVSTECQRCGQSLCFRLTVTELETRVSFTGVST